jgi:two-component system LytT family sensor kinase
MKRWLLHILFWICYYALFGYINVLWDRNTFANLPLVHLLKISLTASALEIIPQIIFSYYMIYRAINNIVKKKFNIIYNVLEIIIVLFLCMLMYRIMDNYITLPYIYKAPRLTHPLLETMHVTVDILDIVFAFGLMLCIKSVRMQLAAKEKEKNLIKEKLETELKFLKSQTNPHFLLNTLNNIYALARKKSDDTAEVVMRLSELLRFMLYESNDKLIKLTDEIKVLEDYLELETLRYNERLTVSFEKDIDSDAYKITPLLLLPFLENAFKHGISETRFESFINITIVAKEHVLKFEIENSKDSCEQQQPAANIGLVNVKRQLELTYSDYTLNVRNNDNVFKVNLTVKLNSYAEI